MNHNHFGLDCAALSFDCTIHTAYYLNAMATVTAPNFHTCSRERLTHILRPKTKEAARALAALGGWTAMVRERERERERARAHKWIDEGVSKRSC